MASTLIGALRVVLSADTAEFKTGLGEAQKATTQFTGQLSGVTTQISSFTKAFAGMFTVGAIGAAANQVLNYASNISDLAAQTGLTTRTIQEMQHAAKMTGASLENFTNAAFKLGTNLAGGSNSVVASLNKLGLSYEAIRNMSPDEQFNAITTALGHVSNAQDRNKIAIDLFGKAAKDILPAISQGYGDIAKGATVAGDAQIQALDAAGDAIDRLKGKVMNLGVTVLGSFAQKMEALGSALQQDFDLIKTHTFDRLAEAVGDWGIIFGKAVEAPKAMGVALRDLPAPLGAVNHSAEEQERIMKALTVQHGRAASSTKAVGTAQVEVDANIQRLTASFEQQIETFRRQNTLQNTVYEGFKLMRVEFDNTIPVLQNLTTNGFEPFKATLASTGGSAQQFTSLMKTTFEGLPQVLMNAIQGGGSIIGAAGAHIGTSLMSKFQETFGPAISAALPFGIGAAINALLPTLGALFGPIAERIGGFFRSIFGGPSAEELRGRQAVADFEKQLHSTLTATQRLEAGNEEWKMTVIAIRDAFIAQGLSEEEAMLAAERLWQSSKKGAAETAAAIAAIESVINGVAGAAASLSNQIDNVMRDRTMNLSVNTDIDNNGGDENRGFASGTMGRLGTWFGSFPKAGFQTALHGIEAVVTPQQAPQFAMDVLSGMGGGALATAGGDSGALLSEIQGLRRDLLTNIPAMSESAARHGSQTAGRRR